MRQILSAAAVVALAIGFAVCAHAAAASIAPMADQVQPQPQQQASTGAPCAAQRDAVDSESNHPGALLDMATDALAACEHARAASN